MTRQKWHWYSNHIASFIVSIPTLFGLQSLVVEDVVGFFTQSQTQQEPLLLLSECLLK